MVAVGVPLPETTARDPMTGHTAAFALNIILRESDSILNSIGVPGGGQIEIILQELAH